MQEFNKGVYDYIIATDESGMGQEHDGEDEQEEEEQEEQEEKEEDENDEECNVFFFFGKFFDLLFFLNEN